MALILDTGPLYAALDRDDIHHSQSRALIDQAREALVVPSPVLVELDYWTRKHLGPGVFIRVLEDVAAGAFVIEDLVPTDYRRVGEIIDRYADADVGFVDAAVLAVTERLGEPKLATLDRRRFTLLRPRHVDALELLPA